MVNKVLIIGNLGNAPKISATQNGTLVANISVATSETFKDQSGQKQKRTEWHKVNLLGIMAEICEQYLLKGSLVCIVGRIQTHQWVDKNGNKRYTTEILARELQMLGSQENTVRHLNLMG